MSADCPNPATCAQVDVPVMAPGVTVVISQHEQNEIYLLYFGVLFGLTLLGAIGKILRLMFCTWLGSKMIERGVRRARRRFPE